MCFTHHLQTETLGPSIYHLRIRRVHCTLLPFKQSNESTVGSDQACFFFYIYIHLSAPCFATSPHPLAHYRADR